MLSAVFGFSSHRPNGQGQVAAIPSGFAARVRAPRVASLCNMPVRHPTTGDQVWTAHGCLGRESEVVVVGNYLFCHVFNEVE